MEENEVKDLQVITNEEKGGIIAFEDYSSSSSTNVETLSNITDSKKVYNLGIAVDCKLNDCIGEKIRVKEVLIKKYTKPLAEPIVNEETGEIREFETNVSCVLVDDNDKSYATGSKTFTYNLINYLTTCGGASVLKNGGFEIQIINTPSSKGNKALNFKLI